MNRRSIGILIVVGVLVASLGAPAAAKKGGHPGPPSGTGLEVTVEPSSGYMWANSVGDKIEFDITVTNSSGGLLTGVVDFSGTPLATFDLARNESRSIKYLYTVVEGNFVGKPLNTQSSVTVGTVTATAETVTDSDDAVMTAYPVLPCEDQVVPGTAFTFVPTDGYSVCSFSGTGSWTLVTTLSKPIRGKNVSGATVRDGVPGNWCMVGEGVASEDTVTQEVYLPTPGPEEYGTCLHGGAGGDIIPVRNTDTFYLASRVGNTVEAWPPTPTTTSSP